MSKATTTSSPLPATPKIPHEKIAARAYEKWVKRGRPQGTDKEDWYEAEAELRAEMQRSAESQGTTPRR
ncbi:MAG: DUF2934 domain-containing protein [Gemmataceae bacterium]|nr:DUF2934 domain-containing protein [Gemmataceae bacterium]MDW8266305.1 DUF2934 domain-containing protein [Gemmataceae bacterium]